MINLGRFGWGACVWIRGQQGNFACMCPVVLLQHCINHACKSVCIEGFFYVNTQGLVSAQCIALNAASHGDTRWLACCLQFIIHIQPLQRRPQCSKDPILFSFIFYMCMNGANTSAGCYTSFPHNLWLQDKRSYSDNLGNWRRTPQHPSIFSTLTILDAVVTCGHYG